VRGFHTLIKGVSFFSSTNVRSHNPLPFPHPLFRFPPQPIWDLTIHSPSWPSSLEVSTPLIKGVSFSSSTDLGSHNPPPFPHLYKGYFVFLLNRCGISQFTPLRGPAVLAGTRSLLQSAFSLAYRTMSSFDTICNGPNPPLVDIVFFELPLKAFKTRLLGRGFTPL